MMRAILFLIGGLAAGWLVATWWAPHPEPVSTSEAGPAGRSGVEGRIAALESALASERELRLELAAGLDTLEVSLRALELSATRGEEPPGPGRDDDESIARDAGSSAPGDVPFAERAGRRDWRDMDPDERRAQRLVDAGFAPDRADWITRRESELRMAALEAAYEARRTGEPSDAVDAEAALRAELGEADYERYLDAMGRSTSVGVRDVLAGSPAEQAGLKPGDRILSYGGERIYDTRDLNDLTFRGTPGEPITLDVVRDGQRLQLVVPRGPLGITGGGRFDRRR